MTVQVIDNWLRSPFISVAEAQRVYVDLEFSMRQCVVYNQRRQSSVITPHCTYAQRTHIVLYCTVRLSTACRTTAVHSSIQSASCQH